MVYKNPMEFKESKKFKSKWQEYRYGDWRRGSGKTFVTIDTEIPTIPNNKVTLPDEAAFHKKQVEIDAKIKELFKAMGDKSTQFGDLVDQKKTQRSGGQGYMSTDMKEKFARINELNKQKKAIYNQVDSCQADNGELIKKREAINKKVHKKWNTSELIPKGLKELKKNLETNSGTFKDEERIIRDIKFLQDSIPFITEKEKIDAKINESFKAKKLITKNLPAILQEQKALQKEIDEQKKDKEIQVETLESLDKQIDRVKEKKVKDQDMVDQLKKDRVDLQDKYYGQLIEYSKLQYLIQDVKWMSDMKKKLVDTKAEKDRRDAEWKAEKARRDAEWQAKKDKEKKEREERKQREVERKEREEARRLKEQENKKEMEEQLR